MNYQPTKKSSSRMVKMNMFRIIGGVLRPQYFLLMVVVMGCTVGSRGRLRGIWNVL